MPPFHLHNVPAPIFIALGSISLASVANEPARQNYMAIALAVAGGTYLDGGLGLWEFPAAIAVAVCAARGLQQPPKQKPTATVLGGFVGYRAIATGWLIHTAWDLLHHAWELPMVSWIPTSSAECAITDVLLAAWMLYGTRGVWGH